MTIEVVSKIAQKCVESYPVIILGSGASAPHGIRGMEELAESLLDECIDIDMEENKSWNQIRKKLSQKKTLEEALSDINYDDKVSKIIIEKTWKIITKDDLKLLQAIIEEKVTLPLTILIDKMLRSIHQEINIVTPNYDRVAEYAADAAKHIHATGFLPGIIRNREERTSISNNRKMKIVHIWKVHGSLDWFISNKERRILSLPLGNSMPHGFTPLIVTPGTNKFERAHGEPFRTAIQGADDALAKANSVLCIGYGFRDSHILPKLIDRCNRKKIPIVILAKKLTVEAKDFMTNSGADEYLVIEESRGGSNVFTHEKPDGYIVEGHELWSFNGFNSLVI